ncbi:MAG: phophatidylserine decarboxylase associated domain-containing protein [Pseudomonadota bacterium]
MTSDAIDFIADLDAHYAQSFGVRAGYLPKDRRSVDRWQRALAKKAAKQPDNVAHYERSVRDLATLIATDGIVRMYVTEMIDQVPAKYRTVDTIGALLKALNHIVLHAPLYNPDPAKQNFFPFYSLFLYMMYTRAGEAAFRNDAFNAGIRRILNQWCAHLDSAASRTVLNTGKYGWLSPSAREYCGLDEFVIPNRAAPHWGFASFNAFFHRQIKPACRPIADPDDPRVIVSPNDGTVYKLARGVKLEDRFWLKGQPYSLLNMMDDSPFAASFIGGDVLQTFLAGNDYHRWHAPISGTVREIRRVPGLMFSQLRSLGFHPNDPSQLPQGYDACVNTRGLVFIESDDPIIGMACVIPIGITEVSSVRFEVEVGQRVRKGDELGFFSYGGSSLCTVFQPGAVERFTLGPVSECAEESSVPVRVNAQIAVASSALRRSDGGDAK